MGFLDRFAPQLLSVLRIVSALLFMCHGTMKLLRFPPQDQFPAPEFPTLIWFAGFLELVGGAMLTAGLCTRIIAFVLSGEMAVAYWMAHAPADWVPLLNGGESAILFCFIFLYLAAAGGGPISIDAMLKKRAT